MPRGKELDDDYDPKGAGRMQTRLSSVTHYVSSPLRRSSRIKQNKYSPGSESDSSISNSQAVQSTKSRTAIMDPGVSDEPRKLRIRKSSVSSEIIEISDIDVPQTPTKRTTRQSSGAASLVSTPTRVNTRASSKRFVRAGSESQSSPLTRITRKTRASSIDPEFLYDRNKSRLSSPFKTRKQASVSPSSSQVTIKEQIELEDRIPYVRLDSTIIEADEIISSDGLFSDSSPDKRSNLSQKINRKLKSMVKDEVEEDCDFEKMETSIDSIELKSNEILKLSKENNETQAEDIDVVTVEDNSVGKIQCNSEKTSPANSGTMEEFSPSSSKCSSLYSTEKDKIEINKESFSDLDKSLTDKCESTKELDTSSEEQKSNKENEVQNIVSNVSVEKSAQPKVTSIKSLVSPFMNKSSSEKETKSVEKQLNLSKRRRSRESTEIAIVHSDPSKEAANSSKEQMDISTKSSSTDKVIVLQDSREVIDEVTNKDEISIKNKTSACNDDVTEVIGELDKIDKSTVIDSKNSTEMESNEVDKRSSINSAKLIRKSRRESLAFGLTEDNNEIELEGQSPSRDEKLSSNVEHKCTRLENLEISTNIESSDDSASMMDEQSASTQDKTIDSFHHISDSTKQKQENLSKHVTESTPESSITIQEISSPTHDFNDTVIQNNQSSDVVEAPKKSTIMDVSSEKTDANDILAEKTAEQVSKRKSTDNLEGEKEISQMEACQGDQENVEIADDASDAGIDLFQDIPADEWKGKDDVETVSMQSTSQPVEEENECDFVLVDRRAWLAAETIKAAKEAESFEYDSDDTVLLKSRLDASQSNCDIEIGKSDTVKKDIPDTDIKENEKLKKRKSRTQRRRPEVSEIDENSSRCTEDEDEDDAVAVEKSLNKSKTVLNQSNDQSISKLNKSKQLIKTSGQFWSNESDEEMEDANELKNSSANELLVDDSEEEFNNSSTRKKLCEKEHSLNKSNNKDKDNATESKKENVLIKNTSLNNSVDQKSKPASAKKTKHLNDNESDNSDVSEDESKKAATHRKPKTLSVIANMGSTDSDENSDKFDHCIPRFLFAKANSDTDNSNNSDINKEYNLDGVKQKFSDDDVAADECRNSEEEVSDPDDNGSDLADFIVHDEIEDEEEENNDEEEDVFLDDIEEKDDKDEEDDEDMQNIEEDEAVQKDEKKKRAHDMELVNMEDENKDVQEEDSSDEEDASKNKFVERKTISLYASTPHLLPKIHKSKNKSVEYISLHRSETETTRDMKKSNVKKDSKSLTGSLLLDSSNSNLSIKKKKKSLVKGNETVLSDTSNLISSSLKKKRKLDPQYSLRGETERDTRERLNEFKSMSTKKLPKSRVSVEFNDLNLNSCKKLNLDDMSESNKDIKSNNTDKVTQNTSSKKDKSKKKSISNSLVDKFLPGLRDFVSNIDSEPMFSKVDSRRTMNIDIETPTLKFLRKEKLNESAPTLKWSTEIGSLQKILFTEEDTKQIKTKEKSDMDEVSDVIQKRNQTKQKKRKKSANENVTDKSLSEDIIELNVPKKKKAKLTELTVVKDSTCEDACQISEKKKKQDKSKKNITDEAALFEDATELNVPKKKPVKLTSLNVRKLVGDSNHEDAYQTIEKQKKKKREELTKENYMNEASFEDRLQLKIHKGKKCTDLNQLSVVQDIHKDTCQISEKKKKKKQDTSRKNVTNKALSKDAIESKKLTQLPVVDDNTSQDMYQVSERKKKKKKQDTTENMVDKVLPKNEIKLKVPKKKKYSTLTHLSNVKDNTHEDVQPIEKRMRRKRDETTKKYGMRDEALFGEEGVQLKVYKGKKRGELHLMQLESVLSKIPDEEPRQIKEEKKRKRKETTKENWMRDEALFREEGVQLKVYKGKKHGELHLMQLESVLSKIPDEEPCQIKEEKKRKRKETTKENWMRDEALFREEGVQLKVYKGKKRGEHHLMQLESVLNKIPDEEPCQIEKERKKRKETTKGNWMDNDEALFGKEGVQSKVYKRKKRDDIDPDQLAIVQDNVREDVCQVEKKKKKKKKQINIAEEITDINEDNILRKKIRRNEMELSQHKKKNKTGSSLSDSLADKQEKRVKRKIKQRSTEALMTERKDTLPVQNPVSNLLKYKTKSKSLQKTASSESKDAARSTENVKKTKKKRDRTEDNENVVRVNVPTRKSKVKEGSKPSSGLKRLSDEMIDIMVASTIPNKKRKVLQNEEKVSSVTTGKSKAATTIRDDLSTFTVPGCATQFQVVNLQDTKKRSSKGAVAAASFRQRMLNRNNRESVSTYLMYKEKMSRSKQRIFQ